MRYSLIFFLWIINFCLFIADSFGQAVAPATFPEIIVDLQGRMGGMVASIDSRYLYASNIDQSWLLRVDLDSGGYNGMVLSSQPGNLALSPDGSKIYLALIGTASVAVVDTATWTLETTWDLDGNVPRDMEATEDRLYIAANEGHYTVLLIVDTANGSILNVHSDNWDSSTGLIQIDPGRGKLYSGVVGSSPSNLCRWNISADSVSLETRCDHGSLGGNGQNLTLSPDGTRILFMVGGGNGDGYTVYNLQALSDKFASWDGEYDIGTYPRDMVYHPSGEKVYGICGSPSDKTIKILNPFTREREGIIEPEYEDSYEEQYKLCISPDGARLVLYAEDDYHRDNGFLHIFDLEGDYSPTPSPAPSPVPVPWIADYNGDGTSDVAVYRPASGLWAVRGITRAYFGTLDDQPVPGDFSGNGTTDIAIFRERAGLWAVRGYTRTYFGGAGDIPVSGLFVNPSAALQHQIGIFRPSSGLWAIKGVTRTYFGGSSDSAVPGYYDPDGGKSIGIFRPSSSLWALKGVTRAYFGGSSDTPVPGDYNGNGRWNPGIFRPASGLWAIQGVTRTYFGGSADRPITGGYRGDGTDCLGIFRGASGLWAVKGLTRAYFGSGSDIPVTR